MAKRRLTDRDIRAMKAAPAGKRVEVWDSDVPGLSVRVTDRGHKSLCFYAMFPGSTSRTPTRRTIGTHGQVLIDDARITARRWVELIRRGVDPGEEEERLRREERARQGTTFGAVAEEFIERRLRGKRKADDNARVIRRELISAWGDRPITEISRGDLIRLVEQIADRPAPSQAHTVFALARRIWNWALNRDYGLSASPCDRVKPSELIGARGERHRKLDDAELRAVWRATLRLGPVFGPVFRVLLLTGCRRSEVSDAARAEFDHEATTWTIPADRYKTGKPHVVPLTAAVLAELEALPRRGDFVFQAASTERPVSGFPKVKARLDKLVTEELGREPEPWVTHDLRRTVRSRLSSLVPSAIAERVLGHLPGGVEKVYDRYAYLDEKRRALELWEAKPATRAARRGAASTDLVTCSRSWTRARGV